MSKAVLVIAVFLFPAFCCASYADELVYPPELAFLDSTLAEIRYLGDELIEFSGHSRFDPESVFKSSYLQLSISQTRIAAEAIERFRDYYGAWASGCSDNPFIGSGLNSTWRTLQYCSEDLRGYLPEIAESIVPIVRDLRKVIDQTHGRIEQMFEKDTSRGDSP